MRLRILRVIGYRKINRQFGINKDDERMEVGMNSLNVIPLKMLWTPFFVCIFIFISTNIFLKN